MMAPPDWFIRSPSPTEWLTSRNRPMSNSEWKKRLRSSRNAGSTLSGYSPSVMWARLSSQRTSRFSGNCAEVLGEVADRQPGAGRIGVDGRGGDGQEAGAVSEAHEAVLVLAPPQRRDPLEVDHRAQGRLGQQVVALDERPQPLQDLVGLLGLALVAQQGRLEIERARTGRSGSAWDRPFADRRSRRPDNPGGPSARAISRRVASGFQGSTAKRAALKPPGSSGNACGRYLTPGMNGLFRPPPGRRTGSPGPPGLRGLSRFDDTRCAAIRIRARRSARGASRTRHTDRRPHATPGSMSQIHSSPPSRMLPGCPGKRRAVSPSEDDMV